MGAWDVGIFDNDTSADVRAFYEAFLREDEATAAERVLEKFAEDVAEPEIAPDVWFGLAGTQWELGRPDPGVARRALAIIESGEDLERWRSLDADEEDVRARGEALEAFAEQLRSPPPPPSMPEPPPPTARFAIGDILVHRLPSGRFVALCVAAVEEGAPVCTFVAQAFPEPPEVDEFLTMDIAEDPFDPEEGVFRAWLLWLVGEDDEGTRAIGHFDLRVSIPGHVARMTWAEMPAYLEQHLGLR